MVSGRAALREILLLLAFIWLFGPAGYALCGGVGAVAWALLGEWFVRYDDQYDWLAGCLAAGHYCGLVGVVGCLVRWARLRGRSAA